MPLFRLTSRFAARRLAYNSSKRLPLWTLLRYSSSKVLDFKLTDIGEGISEVEVLKWFVKEGDSIQEFDKICEVQSDKANVEITSRYQGIVKSLMFGVGDLAKVGKTLIKIEQSAAPDVDSSDSSGSPDEAPESEIATAPSIRSASQRGLKQKPLLTPAVRRIVKEHKLDIAKVNGSGPQGRILKGDVLAIIEGGAGTTNADVIEPAEELPAQPPLVVSHVSVQDTKVPIRGVQRIMVQKMNESNKVPTFGYGDEIDVSALVRLRNSLKNECKELGVKLNYMPFILKATSLALKEYPMLNATVDDAECTSVTYRADHNISIAVDTPSGLIVPNIKKVQERSILGIAKELEDISYRARSNKITSNDLTGGTFSISNIGAIGGTYCQPILFVPEVCIGALGKLQVLPRFDRDGNVVRQEIMVVSWSADHRVIDGATMARFSNRWRNMLETPTSMMLHLM